MNHKVNAFNVEPLNSDNYHTWKFRMVTLLTEKGVDEFIKVKFETVNYPDEEQKKKATAKDNLCKNLLVQCIDDSQIDIIRDKKTSYDMWKCFEELYEQKGLTGQLFLKRKLMQLKLSEGEDLDKFLLQFDNTVYQLKATGAEIKEKDLVCNLLMALPESFETLVTIIENMPSDKINLDLVKSKLRAEVEKRRTTQKHEAGNLKPSAFVSNKSDVCYGCGLQGHIKRNCRYFQNGVQHQQSRGFNRRGNFRGVQNAYQRGSRGNHNYRAGFGGHNNYRGFGRNREYSGARHARKEEEASASRRGNYVEGDCGVDKSICFMGEVKNAFEEINFFIDSGCTDHLVNDKRHFSNIKMLEQPIKIAIAKNDNFLQATGIGNINVLSNNGYKIVKCNIENVLYVPQLRKNLLSVKRLEMCKVKVVFENAEVKLYDDTGELIGTGFRNNLYEIVFKVIKNECLNANVENSIMSLWHQRLGHICQSNLEKLLKNNMVNGMENVKFCKTVLCESCITGKMTRSSFGSRTKAKEELEIIHSDVCGPINPNSHSGNKYFVTFIDDFSNFVCVYMLKNKSEVFSVFMEYAQMVQTKFKRRIATLRCDNGGEYISHDFKTFCKRNGTVIDYTNPYTPEQNGKSERFNRSLVEKGRSMLQHAGMPKIFWDEAVRTAAYLMNRSPSSHLEDKTPAEIWYGKKPNLSNLRIFGCNAYSHVPKELRTKFDPKATKCIMLGYNNNGYRLWNIAEQKAVVSRDVVFDETMFHYKIGDSNRKNVSIDRVSEDSSQEFKNEEITDELEESESKIMENDKTFSDLQESRKEHKKIDATNGKRLTKLPLRFHDYEMYMAFDAMSYVEDVPKCFEEIDESKDGDLWKQAIEREIEAIEKNKTWHTDVVPENAEILDTKWVFTLKPTEEDVRMRYKARLVVRGFAQRNSFNFDEIYSPVAKLSTVRVLLAIGNKLSFHFIQLDVKTAFLNAKLKDDVYIYPPKGVKCKQNSVLKLDKSLYGLKQSSKCWNDEINKFLLSLGFKRSESDYCLYSVLCGENTLYLLLYVDDIILAGPDLNIINVYKDKLCKEFEIKDKGKLQNFLGLEIEYNREEGIIKLNQRRYVESLLKKFGFEGCSSTAIPIDPGLKLNVSYINCRKPVKELVGCLMYLMLGSRPDISFSVNYFSRFQNENSEEVWVHMKRILRYLKGSMDANLIFTRNANATALECFVDADWGGDVHDRKSISGYIIKIFGNTVSWVTRKQNCVALSTTEAELVALCSAVQDCMWFKKVVNDFRIVINSIKIFEDNRGCICLIKNPENNRRVKHIDLKYHFVHELVKAGEITIEYINSKNQQADMLTKGLSKVQFRKNCIDIGLNLISREGV